MASTGDQSDNKLMAEYKSPNGQHTFSYSLPTNTDPESTKEVTAFLSDLRKSAIQMQKDINAFLTQKMEEDKASETNGTSTSTKVDEDKEEDNYGEEVEED